MWANAIVVNKNLEIFISTVYALLETKGKGVHIYEKLGYMGLERTTWIWVCTARSVYFISLLSREGGGKGPLYTHLILDGYCFPRQALTQNWSSQMNLWSGIS